MYKAKIDKSDVDEPEINQTSAITTRYDRRDLQRGAEVSHKNTDEDSYKAKIEKPRSTKRERAGSSVPPHTIPWDVPSNTQRSRASALNRSTRPESVGTRETPIPKSAHLNPPAGFVHMDVKRGLQAYGSEALKMMIVLAPLPAGSNDPSELARRWISSNADQKLVLKSQTKNQGRPMLSFEGMLDANTTIVRLHDHVHHESLSPRVPRRRREGRHQSIRRWSKS